MKIVPSAIFLLLLYLSQAGCSNRPDGSVAGQPEARKAMMAAGDFRKVVAVATKKVFPAIVFIRSLREDLNYGKKQQEEILGSGVIISADGEVLTNWHVVDKSVGVRCLLSDGTATQAEVLGTDKDSDLALLKLKSPRPGFKFPHVKLGDSSQLSEGDFVMAMGAPLGLSRSVSIGIVSCTRRFLEGFSEYSLWIQTDAPINPGNSGGPLVNTEGEVVGITALGVMFANNLGFVIPSNTVRIVLPQLREFGKVKRAWTGLRLQPLRDFNRNVYFNADEGVIVAAAAPHSPALKAGLQPGDRIVSINGIQLTALYEEDLPELRTRLAGLPVDTPAEVVFYRDGEKRTGSLTPQDKGNLEGEELDCPRWDFTVKAINRHENEDLYFYRKEGVFILSVRYPGNASTCDFEPGDIILSIGGEEVKTLDDVKRIHDKALESIDKKYRILFVVLRNGLTRQVVLNFKRDWEK